ncbi:MAG: phospholipid carrier-dependent glycosyltransferase [Thermoguttaceae bacterium]|jgi:hypothetical protein
MSRSPEGKKENSFSNPLFLLFLMAMLVRGVVLFASLDSFNADPDAYLKLAENWYSYGVFGERNTATAFRPPLYPATLKGLVSLRERSERPTIGRTGINEQQFGPRRSESANRIADFFNDNVALSRNASIALLHWILGVATALFVWLYARRVGLSPGLAFFAGLLVVIDPILLHQSRLVMTETFAAFFAALLLISTVVCVGKRTSRSSFIRYTLVGALYGLAALCRPAFYLFMGLAFVNLFMIEIAAFAKRVRERKSLAQPRGGDASTLYGGFFRLLCFLVGCALVVGPWGIRNNKEFGKPILATTHGGYTLYLANNPELYQFYQTSPPFSLWDPEEFHSRSGRDYNEAVAQTDVRRGSKEEELFKNDWYRKEAIETIRSNKETFLYSCAVRVGEFWRFLPNDVRPDVESQGRVKKSIAGVSTEKLYDRGRHAVAIFYLHEFGFALLGCLALCGRRRKTEDDASKTSSFFESPLLWGFILIISVQIPHLFFWTNMRMRAPVEVFLPILAMLGLGMFRYIRSCKKTAKSSK